MPCFVTPTHRYDLSTADDPLLLVLLARSCAIAARLPCHLPARPPPPRGSPSQPGTPAVRAQLADEPESYDPPPQLTRSQRLRRLETGLQRPTTAPAARPPAQQHISAGSDVSFSGLSTKARRRALKSAAANRRPGSRAGPRGGGSAGGGAAAGRSSAAGSPRRARRRRRPAKQEPEPWEPEPEPEPEPASLGELEDGELDDEPLPDLDNDATGLSDPSVLAEGAPPESFIGNLDLSNVPPEAGPRSDVTEEDLSRGRRHQRRPVERNRLASLADVVYRATLLGPA